LSFQFFAPINFIKNIDGFSSIIVNRKQYKSIDLVPEINNSKWSLTWHTSAEFKLPYDINSEISAYYTTGGLEGQVEYKNISGIDIAISKKLMNNRLKVTLEWEEIINSPFRGNIRYDNINADIINNWVNNNVYLQLSYNFGSKFSKDKNRRNSSKEEEDRIDSNN
ncbi:outer membrane beta-barrel protein, partial [bacterium AH-315-A23]|nr:outer membrane beta-barrel protein [bacterium AH-315-A23]